MPYASHSIGEIRVVAPLSSSWCKEDSPPLFEQTTVTTRDRISPNCAGSHTTESETYHVAVCVVFFSDNRGRVVFMCNGLVTITCVQMSFIYSETFRILDLCSKWIGSPNVSDYLRQGKTTLIFFSLTSFPVFSLACK